MTTVHSYVFVIVPGAVVHFELLISLVFPQMKYSLGDLPCILVSAYLIQLYTDITFSENSKI